MELQVGVKIILQNKEGQYLVVCRSEGKYPGLGGQWEIVGGRISPGYVLLENLKREVKEETGLEIFGEPRLVAAQDIFKQERHIIRLTYIGEADGVVKLSEEHTNFKWLSLDEIKNLDPIDGYLKEVLEKYIL